MKTVEVFECEVCRKRFNTQDECSKHEIECIRKNTKYILFRNELTFNCETGEINFKVKKFDEAELVNAEMQLFSIKEQDRDNTDFTNYFEVFLGKVDTNVESHHVILTIYSSDNIDYEPMLKLQLKTYLMKKVKTYTEIINSL